MVEALDILRFVLCGKAIPYKTYAEIPFLNSMQNLALICAQKNTSVFFNILVMGRLKGLSSSDEVTALRDIIVGIMQGCWTLSIAGTSEITETDYKDVQLAIDAINIAIRFIVPNLGMSGEKVQIKFSDDFERRLQDGTE